MPTNTLSRPGKPAKHRRTGTQESPTYSISQSTRECIAGSITAEDARRRLILAALELDGALGGILGTDYPDEEGVVGGNDQAIELLLSLTGTECGLSPEEGERLIAETCEFRRRTTRIPGVVPRELEHLLDPGPRNLDDHLRGLWSMPVA